MNIIEQVMGGKDVKLFMKLLEEQYGKVPKDFQKKAFIQRKERICMVNRSIEQLPLEKLRINSAGLYIAEINDDQVRLSIEGSQIIGPSATKNVYELETEQLKEWFKGNEIKVTGGFSGFVILKHGTDFVGSGKFKEGTILNFVPKARRIIEMH